MTLIVRSLVWVPVLLAACKLSLGAQVPVDTISDTTRISKDWAWVYSQDSLPKLPISGKAETRGDWIRMYEPFMRRVRERGTVLLDKYPKDSKWKWQWLNFTADSPPYYYLDVEAAAKSWDVHNEAFAEVDAVASAQWLKKYRLLRDEYMASLEVSDAAKLNLLYVELRGSVSQMVWALQRGESVDSMLKIYEMGTLKLAELGHRDARSLAVFLMSSQEFQKHNKAGLLKFMRAMKTSKNSNLALYAATKERLLMAGETPIDMKFTTMDGKIVDVKKLRGSIVLLDFWNIGCGTCIETFPKIKELYQEYGLKGFEVISVSLDSDEDRDQALAIITKHRLPWPQVVIGGNNPRTENEYVKRYQIFSVPEMFLLDRQGRLIANGYINGIELREHLAGLFQ